jgi:hypothetical protein
VLSRRIYKTEVPRRGGGAARVAVRAFVRSESLRSAHAPRDRFERDWRKPLWRIDLSVPRAPLPDHVDVAVVGGGFTGLAAALACAAPGASVGLFEARTLGAGASGRTGGIVFEGTAAGPLPGAEACLDKLAELIARHEIACDLDLGGCWTVRHVTGARPLPPSWPDADESWIVRDHCEPYRGPASALP